MVGGRVGRLLIPRVACMQQKTSNKTCCPGWPVGVFAVRHSAGHVQDTHGKHDCLLRPRSRSTPSKPSTEPPCRRAYPKLSDDSVKQVLARDQQRVSLSYASWPLTMLRSEPTASGVDDIPVMPTLRREGDQLSSFSWAIQHVINTVSPLPRTNTDKHGVLAKRRGTARALDGPQTPVRFQQKMADRPLILNQGLVTLAWLDRLPIDRLSNGEPGSSASSEAQVMRASQSANPTNNQTGRLLRRRRPSSPKRCLPIHPGLEAQSRAHLSLPPSCWTAPYASPGLPGPHRSNWLWFEAL